MGTTGQETTLTEPSLLTAVLLDAPAPTHFLAMEAWMRRNLERLGDIRTELPALEAAQGPVLVLYPAARQALAWKIAAGLPTMDALSDWRAGAERLRAFLQQNRGQVTAADFSTLQAAPGATLGMTGIRRAGPDARFPSFPDLPAVEPLHALIAAELLRRDGPARQLAAEIEAMSRIAPEPSEIDLEALRGQLEEALGRKAEVDALRGRLADMEEEQEAILSSLFGTQQDLLRQTDERQAVAAAHDKTKAALAKSREEVAWLRGKIAKREAEIARFRASRTYRLTLPLRRIRARIWPAG